MTTETPLTVFGALLTTATKRQLLEERVQVLATEGYQHTLNRRAAVDIADEQAVAHADTSMRSIDAAIKLNLAELAALDAEPPPADE